MNPIEGYAADAVALIPRYEALPSETVLAAVADLLPHSPTRILDVGAGTGRDGAWLAAQGHDLVAAEPVAAFRAAGQALHPELAWIDDRLPGLPRLRARGERFGLVLLVGVWQHLPPACHAAGIAALAGLVAPGGRVILSIRQGPGVPARPCYPTAPATLVAFGRQAGLTLAHRREAESVQPENRKAGVTWTWLCFDAPADDFSPAKARRR